MLNPLTLQAKIVLLDSKGQTMLSKCPVLYLQCLLLVTRIMKPQGAMESSAFTNKIDEMYRLI